MKSLEICKTATRAGLSDYGTIKYRTGDDWRYNVMLWTGDHWSCDCLGFVHTMVNGFCGDRSKLGGGAIMDKFVTGTTEPETLWDHCHDQSQDFQETIPCELLYMPGHVGLLIPECEPFNDGRIFNAAECCKNSFGGGGMLTYVTENGMRLNHRNGSSAGYWTYHAKFDRVDYTDQEQPEPLPEGLSPADILSLAEDVFVGTWGNNPERQEKLIARYGTKVHRQVQDIMNILYR